jgi:hypothetical protein
LVVVVVDVDDSRYPQFVSIVHCDSLLGFHINESDVGKGSVLVFIGKIDVFFSRIKKMDIWIFECKGLCLQFLYFAGLGIVLEERHNVSQPQSKEV